jgi:hypothetical protein
VGGYVPQVSGGSTYLFEDEVSTAMWTYVSICGSLWTAVDPCGPTWTIPPTLSPIQTAESRMHIPRVLMCGAWGIVLAWGTCMFSPRSPRLPGPPSPPAFPLHSTCI